MAGIDSPRSEPGRLQKALRRMLMRQASVAACEDLGGRFRLLTLEGPHLRGVEWVPGQKAQIAMGAGFATRTYTPIDWDAAAGRTRILGYLHGDAPGSNWLRDARAGDALDLFGPRSSLDAGRMAGPILLFGDETSIGLAYALQSTLAEGMVRCRFEVDRIEDAEAAAGRLGLRDVRFAQRLGGDAHLETMLAELPEIAATNAGFVLSGRAPAIQRFRQSLRALNVSGARVTTKAYWAPGKSGLD